MNAFNTMNAWYYPVFTFMIYSFGGWVAQGIYCGFRHHRFENTGFMYGPVVPIYGFGALIVIYLIDPLTHNFFLVFLATFVLCSVLEYFTSWAMEKLFHRLWWNYSNRPFNIHGRICLLNSLLYGAGGVVVTYITQPWVEDLEKMFVPEAIEAMSSVFLLLFGIDLVCTLVHMAKVRGWIHEIHHHIEVLRLEPTEHIRALAAKIEADRHTRVFHHPDLSSPYKESLEAVHNFNRQQLEQVHAFNKQQIEKVKEHIQTISRP